MHRSGRHGPARAVRCLAPVLLVAALAIPWTAQGEVIAEAAFLADTLPPGSRDLNVSVGISREAAAGDGALLTTTPRVQVTVPVNEQFGLTADVGLLMAGGSAGTAEVDAPSMSLKYELSPAAEGTTGFSASADLFASTHALGESEAAFNIGAVRDLGRVTLRTVAGAVSPIGNWAPRLQGGASLAVEPARGWRLLGEAVGTWAVNGEERSLSLGPAVKYAVTARTALMAGALVGVAGRPGEVAGLVQLTLGL